MKVVFHQWSSSTSHNTLVDLIFVRTDNIPNLSLLPCLEVVFLRRVSSTKGHLPPKVIFYPRLSSTKGRLPQKVVFHRRSSFTHHNTLVDLIFVRTVNKFQPPTLFRSGLKFFFDVTYIHNLTQRTKPYIEAACCLKIYFFLLKN